MCKVITRRVSNKKKSLNIVRKGCVRVRECRVIISGRRISSRGVRGREAVRS